jgi:hypothetical protein
VQRRKHHGKFLDKKVWNSGTTDMEVYWNSVTETTHGVVGNKRLHGYVAHTFMEKIQIKIRAGGACKS